MSFLTFSIGLDLAQPLKSSFQQNAISTSDVRSYKTSIFELKTTLKHQDQPIQIQIRLSDAGFSDRLYTEAYLHPSPRYWRLFAFHEGFCTIQCPQGEYRCDGSQVWFIPPVSFDVLYAPSKLRYFHVEFFLESGSPLQLDFKQPVALQGFSLEDFPWSREQHLCNIAQVIKASDQILTPQLENIALQGQRWSAFKDLLELVQTLPPAKIRIADLAQQMQLQPSTLSKQFQRATGQSLKSYIQQVHVREAEDLLKTSHLSIAKIAHVLGHSSPVAFHRFFLTSTLLTPGQYREMKS